MLTAILGQHNIWSTRRSCSARCNI